MEQLGKRHEVQGEPGGELSRVCVDCGTSVPAALAHRRTRVLPMRTLPGGRLVETSYVCGICETDLLDNETRGTA